MAPGDTNPRSGPLPGVPRARPSDLHDHPAQADLRSEPELRAQIDAATNKAESYNNFTDWLAFGSELIERNDPAEQEKMIKFNTLLANCVIFHIALDMSDVVRALLAEGHPLELDDLATMAPYITETVKRFGEYPIDGLEQPPEAFDPHLHLAIRADAGEAAAA
ncbi:MAG: Tn3 family transposase [Solirubrobacteraceae bacterium]